MAYIRYILMISSISLYVEAKPIMVTFGTNEGPIVPAQPISSTVSPNASKIPAPVYENTDDVPNPLPYKPLSVQQYRNKIFSFTPHSNLILGMPLYRANHLESNFNIEKHNYNRQQKVAKALGLQYQGPQFFEKQDYEIEQDAAKFQNRKLQEDKHVRINQAIKNGDKKRRTSQAPQQFMPSQQASQHPQMYRPNRSEQDYRQRPDVSTIFQRQKIQQSSARSHQVDDPPAHADQQKSRRYTQTMSHVQFEDNNDKHVYRYVPQISVLYSSGLRYYVPSYTYDFNNNVISGSSS